MSIYPNLVLSTEELACIKLALELVEIRRQDMHYPSTDPRSIMINDLINRCSEAIITASQ